MIINNCNFRQQLDDAVNIHGAYVIVEDILAPDKIGVRIGHFQQAGFQFADQGDLIGFINQKDSSDVKFKTTVKSFYKLNKDYYVITLNEEIIDILKKGDVVENLDWYPEVTITNSRFEDNRARGLLLKSPKKTIVKNNYFSNMMSALLISGDINTWWYESGGVQDIIIEGNTFGDCTYGGGNWPVISVSGKLDGKGRELGNIRIINNSFNTFNPAILVASGVKQLEFSDNTIANSKSFTPINLYAPVIVVKEVETFKAKNVKISDDFSNKLKIEDVKNDLSEIN